MILKRNINKKKKDGFMRFVLIRVVCLGNLINSIVNTFFLDYRQ